MAGRIRREDIDELRARINIVDVVGDYVTLKPAGVGSLKGLCPFHDERTPSFHVRPAVGRYHCFGCGEDGDVFQFVMAMDHVGFQDAVERLAQKVGMTLRYEDGRPAQDAGERVRILEANTQAAEYFREQLLTPEADAARRFLGERGFDRAAAERFGVGYAPKGFSNLVEALGRRGVRQDHALAAGLLSESGRGPYDRFRGRLLWPIRDVSGQTIGFGARKLYDDDQGPKYLNTPETAVFHKSQVLYGLDLAKRDIAKQRRAVIVEGYTDVMACHLAGVGGAVATCGTAFGVDHIKVLRRVLGDVQNADTRSLGEVIFTFDPDAAGQQAASRAFAEEHRFAAQTFVAVPEQNLDPCDLRIAQGDEAVRRLIEGRRPMFEFMLRRVIADFDLDTVEGRVGAVRASATILATMRDRALRDGYERTVAGWIGTDPRDVHAATSRVSSRPSEARSTRESSASQSAAADARRPGSRADDATGDVQHDSPPPFRAAQLPADPVTRLERDALVAVLQFPAAAGRTLVERASTAYVAHPALAVVRDSIAASLDGALDATLPERAASHAPDAIAGLIRELSMVPIPGADAMAITPYVRGVVVGLLQRDILRRKADLIGQLQRLGDSDPEQSRTVSRQLIELEGERRSLTTAEGQ